VFSIHPNSGFVITFANEWSVSVRFGYSNYCDNKDASTYTTPMDEQLDCPNAEIAVINPDGDLVEWDDWGDTVKGWMKPNEVMDVMCQVQVL
jgi:hypothetical protein